MRKGRRFGFLIVAALAVFAVEGAGSATADVLCKEMPEVVKGVSVCHSAFKLPTTLHAKDGDVTVSDGKGFQYDCDSQMVLEVDGQLFGKNGLPMYFTELNFDSCTGSCATATAPGLPLGALLDATSAGGGSVTYDKEGELSLSLSGCTASKVSCSYDNAGTMVEAMAAATGKPTQIEETHQAFKKSGGGTACPGELFMSSDYTVEEPNEGKVYVSET